MKIAIIGGGYVGLHTALRLTETNNNWEVEIIDVDKNKIDKFNNGESPIDDFFMEKFMQENPHKLTNIKYCVNDGNWEKYDIVFISLSTNPIDDKSKRLNTDLIFNISKEIQEVNDCPIVVRSTLNIDDDEKLTNNGISYWPEFLSQGIETHLNINQRINIIYDAKKNNSTELFEKIFVNKNLIKVKAKECILIKVMHNSLDAYLINITNLFANISEENNVDFGQIAPVVEALLEKRNKVKRPGIGYGGSCYPKDSHSLSEITKKKQNIDLIETFHKFNIEQQNIFLNKEELIKESKKILVLGMSFKGGTNDITKTPTIALRNWLLENNIKYKIWEPMINQNNKITGEVISNDIESDISKSDLIIVSSDWQEFNDLLKDYEGNVIDLKSYIQENGKMKIHKIGKK